MKIVKNYKWKKNDTKRDREKKKREKSTSEKVELVFRWFILYTVANTLNEKWQKKHWQKKSSERKREMTLTKKHIITDYETMRNIKYITNGCQIEWTRTHTPRDNLCKIKFADLQLNLISFNFEYYSITCIFMYNKCMYCVCWSEQKWWGRWPVGLNIYAVWWLGPFIRSFIFHSCEQQFVCHTIDAFFLLPIICVCFAWFPRIFLSLHSVCICFIINNL